MNPPVDSASLLEKLDPAQLSGQRVPLHQREINRARHFYNPLTGLDISRLRGLLEQGERGLYSLLQDLYRVAEKRYSTLLALKQRRVGAVKKLDWDIKIPARLPKGITQGQAEAQANYLRDAYEAIENLNQALEFVAGASFRGYSHLEKHYLDDNPNLPVMKLQPVPQWHMLRSPSTWEWVYDVTARNNVTTGIPIDPANFLIREVEAPLNEIGSICFLRANLAEKDWSSFIEDYGLPSLFGILAPNTPLEKVKEWLAVIEKVTGNSRGALPPGSDVKFVTPGNHEGDAFEKFLKHQDEVLVLAGTSGLLTMLTASGSGTLAGSAHQEAFNIIALAEAMEISAMFQAQFDKPLLEREFPSQRQAAYFQLAALDEEDLDALAKRLQYLAAAGLIADPEEISEKLGIKLERGAVNVRAGGQAVQEVADPAARPDDSALKNRQAVDAGATVFRRNAVRKLSQAESDAVQPMIDRLAAFKSLPDDQYAEALRKFRADLPRLFAEARLQVPDIAGVWEQVLATALVDGLTEAPESLKGAA